MASKFTFSAAIRGFHVYRQVWQPVEDERLVCTHETGNAFDLFSIKATNRHGVLSGHLPREISRPTKFLLDRGASVTATLTDTNYRRSPLFQGGLEIQCKVEVEMPSTLLAQKLIGRFREMVDKLYEEPEHPVIVGSYLESQSLEQSTLHPRQPAKKKKPAKKASKINTSPPSRGGIRYYMLSGSSENGASGSGSSRSGSSGNCGSLKTQKKKVKLIEINDSDSD